MILYFLKSAICLALLLAFYHLVLEKEKMHTFNRFYLLGSVLFSFLAPLYIIYTDVVPVVYHAIEAKPQTFTTEVLSSKDIVETFNYTKLFTGIYIFISFILMLRFCRNLFNIIYKISKNSKVNYLSSKLVLVDDKIVPHTFWNYIFINKNEYESNKIEQELFTHELTHATQKHTLDVLILEILQILFWINPLFILLKKAVQLNHEFLADEKVINQHKNTFQYQHLLLNRAAWKNDYYLASNLNYSLTKKRLLMMTTQSSHTKILLKKLAIIPLLTGFVFLFAERVEAQEEPIETIVEEVSNKQRDLTDSEVYKEYFHSKGYFRFKDKNGKYISKKYSELTNDEKKRLIPPPPLKSKKKIPTQNLIDDLKDEKKYAVWIDGKVIKNDVLNNYKASDFSNHFVSFVYKNARTKRFPQEYQSHLETKGYFDNQNKKRAQAFKEYLEKEHKVETIEEKAQKKDTEIRTVIEELGEKYNVNNYKELNKTYEIERNKKPHFIESNAERQKTLNNLYSKLGSLYFDLPKEEKKKTKRPINPHHPYLTLMKNNKVFYKLKSELTKEDELLFPPPPPVPNASKEQILKAKKAYEEWKVRTGNRMPPPPPPPITPLDHVIKMAKKDATFYYEGNKINSDKAIELLKNNKNLNIDTRNNGSEKTIVRISKNPIKLNN